MNTQGSIGRVSIRIGIGLEMIKGSTSKKVIKSAFNDRLILLCAVSGTLYQRYRIVKKLQSMVKISSDLQTRCDVYRQSSSGWHSSIIALSSRLIETIIRIAWLSPKYKLRLRAQNTRSLG